MKTRKALATSGKETKTYRIFECSYFSTKQDFLDFAAGLPDDFDGTPTQVIKVVKDGKTTEIDISEWTPECQIIGKQEQNFGDNEVVKALNNGLYLLGHASGTTRKTELTDEELAQAGEWAIENDRKTYLLIANLPKKAQNAYLKLCYEKALAEKPE
jgi:hypothetical protein